MIYICLTLLAVAAILVAARIYYEVTHFEVVRYELPSSKIEKDCRLVLISDLHGCRYGAKNERLLQAIYREEPQIILIAGDLITAKHGKTVDFHVAADLLQALSGRYEIYYVNGNHESRARDHGNKYGNAYMKYLMELEDRNVKYNSMNDKKLDVGNNLTISGIELEEDLYKRAYHKPKMKDDYISQKLGALDTGRFNVLMAHNPIYFEQYAKSGADLVVAGHNHGGVIQIPFLGGLISTQYKLFEQYDKGRFQRDNTTMILSGGLGSHTINIRLNNLPQLVIIDLKKQ